MFAEYNFTTHTDIIMVIDIGIHTAAMSVVRASVVIFTEFLSQFDTYIIGNLYAWRRHMEHTTEKFRHVKIIDWALYYNGI